MKSNCIVAAGTVVNGHVPDRCMVAGNPPRIVRTDLVTGHYGRTVPWADGRNDADTQLSDGNPVDQPLDGAQPTPQSPDTQDSHG